MKEDEKSEKEQILRAFGRNVRLARRRLGLTQEKLSELANLHPTYIGMVERGSRNVSVSTAFFIAKALGCSLDELLIIRGNEQNR